MVIANFVGNDCRRLDLRAFDNDDVAIYKTAQRITSDEMRWLEYSTEDAWKR